MRERGVKWKDQFPSDKEKRGRSHLSITGSNYQPWQSRIIKIERRGSCSSWIGFIHQAICGLIYSKQLIKTTGRVNSKQRQSKEGWRIGEMGGARLLLRV